MAERNRAAVHVELLQIGPSGLQPCQRRRREGLVGLIEVDVVDFHTGALKRESGRRERLFEHDDGMAGCDRHIDDASLGLEVMSLQRRFTDDDGVRCAVIDLRRIGRRDHAALKLFTHAIVAIDDSRFKAINSRDRSYSCGSIQRRMEQVEASIERYLSALETADRREGDLAQAKTTPERERPFARRFTRPRRASPATRRRVQLRSRSAEWADSVAIIAASTKVDMPFVMSRQMARFLFVPFAGPAIAAAVASQVAKWSP